MLYIHILQKIRLDLDLIEEAVRNNLRGEVKVPARKKVFKGSRVKSSI